METRSWLSAARGPSLTSNAHHAGASTNATTLPPSLGTGATACQLDHPGRPGKLVQSPGYTGRRRGNRRQRTPMLTLHRRLVAAFPACPAAPCPACLVVGGIQRPASRGFRWGIRQTTQRRRRAYRWRRAFEHAKSRRRTKLGASDAETPRADGTVEQHRERLRIRWFATKETRNCASELFKVSPRVVVVQHKRTAGLGVQFDVARSTGVMWPPTACR